VGFDDVRIAKERSALRSMKKSSFLETARWEPFFTPLMPESVSQETVLHSLS